LLEKIFAFLAYFKSDGSTWLTCSLKQFIESWTPYKSRALWQTKFTSKSWNP